jgi:hypothetical protein
MAGNEGEYPSALLLIKRRAHLLCLQPVPAVARPDCLGIQPPPPPPVILVGSDTGDTAPKRGELQRMCTPTTAGTRVWSI